MDQKISVDLAEIGREAVQDVAGVGMVERVEVETGHDSLDRPALFFSFLIDRDRDRQRAGLVRIRMVQKLRDELIARGYDHYPIIQVLSRADWEKRAGA